MTEKRNVKELVIIGVLAVILAVMDITGFPFIFLKIEVLDIDPMYWSLMLTFVLIGIIAALVLHFLCPNWKVGFKREGLLPGFVRYGICGVLVGVISCVAFYVGLPMDGSPTVWKVQDQQLMAADYPAFYNRYLCLALLFYHFRRVCGFEFVYYFAHIYCLGSV